MSAGLAPTGHLVALLFKRVGDSLLATPALRALRKSGRFDKLTVVCEASVVRVFQHNPWVDEIHSLRVPVTVFRLARLLREIHPAAIVDFLSDPRSAMACFLSGCAQRVGFAHRYRQLFYSHLVPEQQSAVPLYSAEHKLGALRLLGATGDGLSLDFFLTQSDRDSARHEWQARNWSEHTPVAAFFVHSRRSYKQWPVERFAEVIRQMRAANLCEPLLLDTGDGSKRVESVRRAANLPELNVIHVYDLGVLGAVLSLCKAFIGNDGGPKHVSVAVGTPTIALFLHESSNYWTPPDDPRHLAFEKDRNSDPIDAREIQPAEVVAALRRILSEVKK